MATTQDDVEQWFDRYVETFMQVVQADHTDPEPLLEFFSVPMTLTTATGHQPITDRKAMAAALSQELQTLKAADFAGSSGQDRHCRILHDRAALIEVIWSRHDHKAREFQRIHALYLCALTDNGWRTCATSAQQLL